MSNRTTLTRFVCLANSIKLGGRCLAGLELDHRQLPKILSGSPKWIRPISESKHGEVENDLVEHLHLLDIVELEVTGPQEEPGYQSENVYFNPNSIKRIGNLAAGTLDALCDQKPLLFGNKGAAVSEDVIDNLTHSLMLIKPKHFKVTFPGKLKIAFSYGKHGYELSVTDPVFMETYRKNINLLEGVDHIYLCISLALAHNGWHSKLIAGVIL